MKLLTKVVMSDSSKASHSVLMPPSGRGTARPNDLNHIGSGGGSYGHITACLGMRLTCGPTTVAGFIGGVALSRN